MNTTPSWSSRVCNHLSIFSVCLLLVAGLSGCGKDTETQTQSTKPSSENKPTVHVPEPTKFYEGTPYWLTQSAKWPAEIEGAVNADDIFEHDSLNLRITDTVIQSFIAGQAGKDTPLLCWVEVTARPVPKQLIGRSFMVDSIVYYDPIKKRTLPALPMLSSERYTEGPVVRTRFANNLSRLLSPDLVENQPLEPTVYITVVDAKKLKIKLPPSNVAFLREFKREGIPTDSLKWGPS